MNNLFILPNNPFAIISNISNRCYTHTLDITKFSEFGKIVITRVIESNQKDKETLIAKNEYTIKSLMYHNKVLDTAVDILSDEYGLFKHTLKLKDSKNPDDAKIIKHITSIMKDIQREYSTLQ